MGDAGACADPALARRVRREPKDPKILEQVRDYIGKVPYMTYAQAQTLDDLFTRHHIKDCLELGFHHGVSSAYITAILKKNGGGHLTTIDRVGAKANAPNVEQLLEGLGLRDYATIHYEEVSYNWRLMDLIESTSVPLFDFCYIDGGHRWEPDGFAFFLVEKLLRRGGWILFDDLNHSFLKTYSERGLMPASGELPKGTSLTEREFRTEQIRKVWELLVKQHSSFGNFRDDERWGFAQKL
jgi:predicted O-methyltransferase YrrM